MWDRLYNLACGIQHYPWGERQRGEWLPYIADLVGTKAEPDKPFAELWMGAHPSLPSQVSDMAGCPSLGAVIDADPAAVLGDKVLQMGCRSLPFLLKVLSCERPLSIQAHPDRERAQILHGRDPMHYPDPNHKPEIAIALTPFDALSQFRQLAEIAADVGRLRALDGFFRPFGQPRSEDWLRQTYRYVFEAPQVRITMVIDGILEQLEKETGSASPADRCFQQLNRACPGDRGVLSAYFLNTLHLDPGEAMFMAADEPHAYLNGTIVECMANSDNVVRAGLTGKFIDRDVLLEMLTYRQGAPRVWSGEEISGGVVRYAVPTPEFEVDMCTLSAGSTLRLHSGEMVSLMLVLAGNGFFRGDSGAPVPFARGTCWLWPAGLPEIRIDADEENVRIVRARPNPGAVGSA